MLSTGRHGATRHLPAEISRPLKALCSTLAIQLASRTVRSDELNASFDAMEDLLTRTIRSVSRDWNRSNDFWRVLPLELRAMCWSYLPQSDLLRLAYVCSSWRDLSRGIPALWTSIDIRSGLDVLDTLIARSGTLPFELAVLVYSVQEHAYVDDCVRKHAHRLRGLHISDRDVDFAGNSRGQGLFQYPAPMLEHFSLKLVSQKNDGNFILAPDIFTGCAPNLRSLTLHEIPFPTACPVFESLTTLEMSWSIGLLESGLQHIFIVSPALERLVLGSLRNIDELPPVPTSGRLRKVELTADRASFTTLRANGYLGVPQLEVTTYDSGTVHEAAMYQSASLHLSLSIASIAPTITEVILRGETGETARLKANDGLRRTPYAILRDAPSFSALQRLVLPTATRYTTLSPTGVVLYPYLAENLHLPALRTLALAHGATGTLSLFDPSAVWGALVAPRLSRVEIIRTGNERDKRRRSATAIAPGALALFIAAHIRRSATAIAPGALALFIEAHILCDDLASLELVVAPENADLLDLGEEDGMEALHRRVGKFVYN